MNGKVALVKRTGIRICFASHGPLLGRAHV